MDIRHSIEKLIALYESEKQRADELASKLAGSEAECAACKQQITDLKKQIDNLKLTGALVPSGEGAGQVARQRIDKLIAEIDRCIELLED